MCTLSNMLVFIKSNLENYEFQFRDQFRSRTRSLDLEISSKVRNAHLFTYWQLAQVDVNYNLLNPITRFQDFFFLARSASNKLQSSGKHMWNAVNISFRSKASSTNFAFILIHGTSHPKTPYSTDPWIVIIMVHTTMVNGQCVNGQ